MEFSEKLKALRAQKEISQAKLAADIHISRSAVAKWENGLGLPGEESLKLLAEYFGVSASELLPNKDNEEILGAIMAGLSLILYAQIKYNRGIF